MILDQFGKTLDTSLAPSLDDIKKANRDMTQYGEWEWMVSPTSMGALSYRQLRDVYKLSSAARPAVDSIAREVSTLPWKVINKDFKYHNPSEVADIVDLLENPNLDDEDLAVVLAKFLTDVLVVGKGTIEKVRNGRGTILELVARDACLFKPKLSKQGFIVGYIEYERNSSLIAKEHKKEDIIYKYFTPLSYTFAPAPIIETIINEIALLMLSVKAIAWAFTRDEIPPGVLHLGEIGQVALDRAKESFEATKGMLGQNKIRVVDNVDKVAWVQFTRPFREMQVAELMPMIERIVARNFGLSPVESSLSDVARGVAEMSFKSSQSKLVMPLMTLLSSTINRQIVRDFSSTAKFIFIRNPQESFNDMQSGLGQAVDRGLITDNEARLTMGFDPVPGGDTRSVKLGNERVPLDPKTGKPIYRNSVNPGQAIKPNSKTNPVKEEDEDDEE